jgi:23S rRNA (uracil1939-C5)-methyltransferase
VVDAVAGAGGRVLQIRHHVRAFFQGNRYLLQALVDDVRARVDAESVADLYAGVGLFSLALAAEGRAVEAVEGDEWAAADLRVNAAAWSGVGVHHEAVEAFVRRPVLGACGAVVVDPPRTGLSAEVSAALAGARVRRLVYVSCDPATLARDVRVLTDAGYTLGEVRVFDLFPRSAHVETVVTLAR